MNKIRWGIIGPGSIANNFADALLQTYSAELTAVASFNDERRKVFGVFGPKLVLLHGSRKVDKLVDIIGKTEKNSKE